jgi:hypothetical protein
MACARAVGMQLDSPGKSPPDPREISFLASVRNLNYISCTSLSIRHTLRPPWSFPSMKFPWNSAAPPRCRRWHSRKSNFLSLITCEADGVCRCCRSLRRGWVADPQLRRRGRLTVGYLLSPLPWLGAILGWGIQSWGGGYIFEAGIYSGIVARLDGVEGVLGSFWEGQKALRCNAAKHWAAAGDACRKRFVVPTVRGNVKPLRGSRFFGGGFPGVSLVPAPPPPQRAGTTLDPRLSGLRLSASGKGCVTNEPGPKAGAKRGGAAGVAAAAAYGGVGWLTHSCAGGAG